MFTASNVNCIDFKNVFNLIRSAVYTVYFKLSVDYRCCECTLDSQTVLYDKETYFIDIIPSICVYMYTDIG